MLQQASWSRAAANPRQLPPASIVSHCLAISRLLSHPVLPLLLFLLQPQPMQADTMVTVQSCDFNGMTLHMIRNPLTHEGTPYIAGYSDNKRCPRLLRGASPNEWYISWTLEQMGDGLCGRLKGLHFTVQITIGHCDCDLHLEQDYTAKLTCIMLDNRNNLRAGADPGVPPESTSVTLQQQAAVLPLDPDEIVAAFLPPPVLTATVRLPNGSPIQPTDQIYVGDKLDVLIQIIDDKDDYWGHLSVSEMQIRALGEPAKYLEFIYSMCLGSEVKLDESGVPITYQPALSGYFLAPAEDLQICQVCSAAATEFGVVYDASISYGEIISIPFELFLFQGNNDGLEIHLKVFVCATTMPQHCVRGDCPAVSRKRRFAQLLGLRIKVKEVPMDYHHHGDPSHTRDKRAVRQQQPRDRGAVAAYDIQFLLKINNSKPHIAVHHPQRTTPNPNGGGGGDGGGGWIVFQPSDDLKNNITASMTEAPEVKEDHLENNYSYMVEISLIVVGIFAVMALSVPCIYACHRHWMKKARTHEHVVTLLNERDIACMDPTDKSRSTPKMRIKNKQPTSYTDKDGPKINIAAPKGVINIMNSKSEPVEADRQNGQRLPNRSPKAQFSKCQERLAREKHLQQQQRLNQEQKPQVQQQVTSDKQSGAHHTRIKTDRKHNTVRHTCTKLQPSSPPGHRAKTIHHYPPRQRPGILPSTNNLNRFSNNINNKCPLSNQAYHLPSSPLCTCATQTSYWFSTGTQTTPSIATCLFKQQQKLMSASRTDHVTADDTFVKVPFEQLTENTPVVQPSPPSYIQPLPGPTPWPGRGVKRTGRLYPSLPDMGSPMNSNTDGAVAKHSHGEYVARFDGPHTKL